MKTSRWFIIGFVVGFLGVFVSTLALASQTVEVLAVPFLAPARFLLKPIMEYIVALSGPLNIIVFALLNGIIYGFFFWAVVALIRKFKSAKDQRARH